MPRRIVVSVHDATPPYFLRLIQIFKLLEDLAIDRTSILAVPNFHGTWDLRNHPKFVDWLRTLEQKGHEIVLHGLEHQEVKAGKESLYRQIVRCALSREGEFYTLSYDAASDRIQAGLDLLREVDFQPVGFVAPGWMQNVEVVRAIRDRGLRYTTTLTEFHDLERGIFRRSIAICHTSRFQLSALASVIYCSAISRLVNTNDLVRVAIHPGDITHPGTQRSLTDILRRCAVGREQATYRDLLE